MLSYSTVTGMLTSAQADDGSAACAALTGGLCGAGYCKQDIGSSKVCRQITTDSTYSVAIKLETTSETNDGANTCVTTLTGNTCEANYCRVASIDICVKS